MMRAAFFDVGDTLVEAWRVPELMATLQRRRLVAQYGERDWYEAFLGARHGGDDEDPAPQETLRWIEDWLRTAKVPADDLDIDRIRIALTLPLDEIGALTPGADEALRWCKAKGLTVVLVTNTLWRGDAEVWEDWRRFGLARYIDGVASSHDVGWRKPSRAMFERALHIAGCAPADAFMVGDRLRADIWGAEQVGLRTVWRQPKSGVPQADIAVVPDLTVDELTELPESVAPWLL